MRIILLVHLVAGQLSCWNENDSVIRCNWPDSIDGSVEYTRASDSSGAANNNCNPDPDLTTIDTRGCTISPFNPNIHYNLLLYEHGNIVSSMLDFDPHKFLKITIPPENVIAERRDNGTVFLHWENNINQMFMTMMLGDSILYRLVWNARMELEEHYRVLGIHNELQQEIYLNDLPNDQILELCLQMRKKGSLIEDWSKCSERTTLYTRVSLPTELPPTPPPTVKSKVTNDLPRKERLMITIAAVIFLVSLFVGTIIVKNNWRTIKNYIYPKLPIPDMYFDDVSDTRQDLIQFVEEYDRLSIKSPDSSQGNTMLVQAQIESDVKNLLPESPMSSTSINRTTPLPQRVHQYRAMSQKSNNSLDSGFGSPEPNSQINPANIILPP